MCDHVKERAENKYFFFIIFVFFVKFDKKITYKLVEFRKF